MSCKKRHAIIAACVVLMVVIIGVVAIVLWRDHVDSQDEQPEASRKSVNRLLNDTEVKLTDSEGIAIGMLTSQQQSPRVNAFLGVNLLPEGRSSCSDDASDQLCFSWQDTLRLEITGDVTDEDNQQTIECITVNWTVAKDAREETGLDCFDMSTAHWFGGFEEGDQNWPMDKNFRANLSPFVTGDPMSIDRLNHPFGDVIEPMFISTSGIGIFIHESTPLYVSVNQSIPKKLCLQGRTGKDTPYRLLDKPHLRYDICRSPDITKLWKGMAQRYIAKPKGIMSPEVIRKPIWCTWAAYKGEINTSTVLEYAKLIRDNGFPISQLEIDDNWTKKYGDFTFDESENKFKNAVGMIKQLSDDFNIPVTVWMHPFFNIDSQAFQELSSKKFLLQTANQSGPILTKWWRGDEAGVLDVTNPEAVKWYTSILDNLRNIYNVTSFKFDAGETNWLPDGFYSKQPLTSPNIYTKKYAEMAFNADSVARRQEVRVGYRSQEFPMMVRMLDRASDWSYNLGLKTLVPCALTFGMMGYPFVLPDMIGGNAYSPDSLDDTKSFGKELFIRWLQASALMPVLQFSVGPWVYDESVINITRKFTDLHEQYSDLIIELAQNAAETGEPIVRPLWWIDPDNEETFTIDSQFLLGNKVLVAPVLEENARSRDIYLPSGRWKDKLKDMMLEGKQWLRNYKVELDELAYFTREN